MVFLCLILSALLNCHWFNFSFTKKKKNAQKPPGTQICTCTTRYIGDIYTVMEFLHARIQKSPHPQDPRMPFTATFFPDDAAISLTNVFFSVDRSPFY